MSYLESLQWRYATKKFDSSKKLSQEQLEFLKDSMRLTASSFGLQPYKVLIVTDQNLKQQLVEHSYSQPQVADASHLIVIAAQKETTNSHIDQFIQSIHETTGAPLDKLAGYADMMKGWLGNTPKERQLIWAQKQCYILLGNLLSACAQAEIDSCPMEGFLPEKYDELLGLNGTNYTSTVILPVGFRSDDDDSKDRPKVRKSSEELFSER